MKKFLFPLILMLALYIAGCGDDAPPGPGPGPVPPLRLVADSTVVAPTLSDVDEAVWSDVAPLAVEIGGSSTYGVNGTLGKQRVTMKAIKKSNMLYIRAQWHDPNANIWAGYFRCSSGGGVSENKTWEHVTTEGEDVFSIIFDGQDNGDEMADCATMCHATDMLTTGGGKADVWKWMSTQSAPTKMSGDYYINATKSDPDFTPFLRFVRDNIEDLSPNYPDFMHIDEELFTGSYLYEEDTTNFLNYEIAWPTGHRMPGYRHDSTIFNLVDRDLVSFNNVRAISHFDSTSSSSADYTWTIVFARALNTTHDDDVNLSVLDSVQISIAVTHNDSKAYIDAHSGSKPLWLILNN